MASIPTLLKVFAIYTINSSLLPGTRAQVPEDPSCKATLEMVHNGLMAVTDPGCLVANGEPGCDLFGLPDCRVCALTSESLDDDIPLCESLDIFNQEDEPLGEESLADEGFHDEPQIPPPVAPVTPVDPIEPVEPVDPTESSVEEDYVPIVIVLPSDIFIEPASSIWDDGEGSLDFTDTSSSSDEQDGARRLRTQLWNPGHPGLHGHVLHSPLTQSVPMTTRTQSSPKTRSSFTWLAVALLAVVVATFARDPKALELAVRRVLSVDVRSGDTVNCADAHQFLTDVMPVKGFHVLCIETTTDALKITAFKDGMHANSSVETTKDLTVFTYAVERELLQIPEPSDEFARKYKQPSAYFTADGEKLEKNIVALENRIVFLFEGGQFVWPGIRIGHKTLVKDTFGRGDLVLETISMTPLVFSVEDFLRDDEIDVILELSMPHLAPSGVTLQDGHEDRPATDWRTSTTYWLDSSSHPVVQDIDKRTADLVKVPLSHQESVQVLRYERTQHYDQHLDYFSVDLHQHSPDVLKQIEYGYKNRMITVFWYMSDVAKGGHTNFARAGGLPHPPSNKGCPQGISVAPKKRKVVVFYSMLPNGDGDPMSLHAGCPVEEGIKLSGNKWVWNKPRSDAD